MVIRLPYGYIYLITNLINQKKYIGKHKSGKFDPSYHGSGGNHYQNALSKYGWDNFKVDILCWCFSEEELNSEEEFLIDYFNCVLDPNYYNETDGGAGGWRHHQPQDTRDKIRKTLSGRKRPESTKRLIGSKNSGPNNPNYGKHLPLSTRMKISRSKSGIATHSQSEETKKLLSELNSGPNHPSYGQKRSKETRAKISLAKKGKSFSEAHKQSLRVAFQGRKFKCTCKLCNIEFLGNSPTASKCSRCKKGAESDG